MKSKKELLIMGITDEIFRLRISVREAIEEFNEDGTIENFTIRIMKINEEVKELNKFLEAVKSEE